MELSIIKKALQHYLASGDCDNVAPVAKAIEECEELSSRGVAETDHITIISTVSLTDLLNMATYDDFGRLAKQTDNVSFEQYAAAIRKASLANLPDSCLQLGYYFIRDLWHDNEEFGSNNPDGTCKN